MKPDKITLDGHPAKMRQTSNKFVLVYRKDGKGGDVEYSMNAYTYTVAHKKGEFKS